MHAKFKDAQHMEARKTVKNSSAFSYMSGPRFSVYEPFLYSSSVYMVMFA